MDKTKVLTIQIASLMLKNFQNGPVEQKVIVVFLGGCGGGGGGENPVFIYVPGSLGNFHDKN